ncbi:hypothetical protein, partial [Shigella flexneri]|uniref:hypothetical protein n=1 Tax=Shigella flexneri TaxID=623 RepID=UPI003F53E661
MFVIVNFADESAFGRINNEVAPDEISNKSGVEYDLKSTQLLSVIDAISEGPVDGPVDGLKSVLLNGTPVLDSEGKT